MGIKRVFFSHFFTNLTLHLLSLDVVVVVLLAAEAFSRSLMIIASCNVHALARRFKTQAKKKIFALNAVRDAMNNKRADNKINYLWRGIIGLRVN